MHARPAALAIVLAAAACGPPRRPVSLVVEGATVITENAANDVFSPGAVVVDGDTIVEVGDLALMREKYTARERVDAGDEIVLPGLVNTHTHAPMVLYRGLADDLALEQWLEQYIFPAEARTVSPEFVRIGTRLAALEMIESGTTTFADMYYFEDEIARATREAGLRAVLGETIIRFPSPDAQTPAEGLARAEAFIDEFEGDALVTPAVAPHAVYTLDRGSLLAAAALARRRGVPLLIHLAETKDEVERSLADHQASPVMYLKSIGFWGPRVLAAHGVWLDAADLAELAGARVGIAHNAESNMKLASGAAPVTRMRAAGVAVGLGTDGAASNNDLDMFEAMRQASFLAKLSTGDPTAVPAAEALAMATIGGARALGMEAAIGSLEPGKRADIITVAMGAPRQTPLYDPLSHLVYVTRGTDVQNTIVNGRPLMRRRRVLTLDRNRVLADARRAALTVRRAVAR
jgi:5-methylthioadenosine/S-adenosylhomocysteine deaminase